MFQISYPFSIAQVVPRDRSAHSHLSFCLLSKNLSIKSTCCFVWVWNLVLHATGRTWIEGVWEQCAEENIETKKEELVGCWRKLHNEGIHNLRLSQNITVIISRRIRWRGHVAYMGNEKCIEISGLKTKGNISPSRPRSKWEDNIRADLRETGWEYVDWTNLAQDMDQWRALVNVVMNFRVPLKAKNFLTSRVTTSFLLLVISQFPFAMFDYPLLYDSY